MNLNERQTVDVCGIPYTEYRYECDRPEDQNCYSKTELTIEEISNLCDRYGSALEPLGPFCSIHNYDEF